jgi:hypothetical protein
MAKKSERPREPFWFTPPADRALPPAEQSRFKFRPLRQYERLEFMDNTEVVTEDGTGSRQLRFRSFTQSLELVLLTLIEAENFPAGEPVKYPKEGTREEKAKYIEDIDDGLIYVLGQEVFNRSTLGQDSKNS